MTEILSSVLIFVAVALGLTVVFQLVGSLLSPEDTQVLRRMRGGLERARGEPAADAPLFKDPNRLTLDAPPATGLHLPRASDVPGRPGSGWEARLDALIEESGLPLTQRQFLSAAAGIGLVLGLAATLLGGPVLGFGAAAVGATALPLYARARRNARREKMLNQLPNAFGLMARVIRAGHSVPQAMQAVAEAFEGPLATEFTRCQKQQNLGIRPEVSFQEMAVRTGILEVRVFVTAMLIQRQTGGNLSDMLERLAALVRDRLRIRKQVRTLTAEGRLQGMTLLVLPFLVFGALMVINREYAQVLLDHPSLLLATGAVMGVGVLWIRRIIDFDI